MEIRNLILTLVTALCLGACQNETKERASSALGLGDGKMGRLVVVTADFKSMLGKLGVITLRDGKVQFAEQTISSDAWARSLPGSPYIFVVNRFGFENVQVYQKASLTPAAKQYSLKGQGENGENALGKSIPLLPNLQDLALVSPSVAYVTALNKRSLIQINPMTGAVTGTALNLSSYADADGFPEMANAAMVTNDRLGELLWVQLQRVDGGKDRSKLSWTPTDYSSVLVIDPKRNAVEKEIKLTGKNPVTDFRKLGNRVLVGTAGEKDTRRYSGIEALDPDGLVSRGFVAEGSSLEGTPADFVAEASFGGWAILNLKDYSTRLVRWTRGGAKATEVVMTTSNKEPLVSLAYDDERKILFAAQRTQSVQRVLVWGWDGAKTNAKFQYKLALPPSQIFLTD